MADTNSLATTSTTSDLKKPVSDQSSSALSSSTSKAPTPPSAKTSWRKRLHLESKTEEPGKESWRDASLSEEKRWKEWQKAKDREQKEGGVTGTYTQFYKAKGKGKWGYWLAAV